MRKPFKKMDLDEKSNYLVDVVCDILELYDVQMNDQTYLALYGGMAFQIERIFSEDK